MHTSAFSSTYPLTSRLPNDVIAFLTDGVNGVNPQSSQSITVATFLQHVDMMAKQLPEQYAYVINLCSNRYLFLVGFCAALVKGQTNLLPPNKNIATQKQLRDAYKNCHIVHDGCEIFDGLPSINISTIEFVTTEDDISSPLIKADHLAAISFTSGSTGDSKPILKYWETFYTSTQINHEHMIGKHECVLYQLATMPAQHMWGLETSILIPLHHNICMCDAKPLYPSDIIQTLEKLPEPRLLVTTPIHLKALCGATDTSLTLQTILSATSPLSTTLATTAIERFSCTLKEVYGCSEVGSMAYRETAKETEWHLFKGITFTKKDNKIIASARHLPESTTLQDNIHLTENNTFTLLGRSSDMINIAGKRGSLLELNQVLLKFPNLIDGAFIHPETIDQKITRLCAIVALKSNTEKHELVAFLREHLDSAFLPRPIYIVEKLPREENGKLLKKKIDALYRTLKNKSN